MSEAIRLETISFKDLQGEARAARRTAIDSLRGAMFDIGFLAITDLDAVLPQRRVERHFALGHELFSLPEDLLKQFEDVDDQHQQGYTPFGLEFGDPRKYWMTGPGVPPYKANIFPTLFMPEYGQSSLFLYNAYHVILTEVARGLEEALALRPKTITGLIAGGNHRMRHLYYIVGPEGGQAATEHGDINWLTALSAFDPGLRLRPHGGELTPVHIVPGQVVVDTGEMLSIFLRTHFSIPLPFTRHDVVMHPGQRIRQSLAHFLHAVDHAVVNKETGETSRVLRAKRLSAIGHAKH